MHTMNNKQQVGITPTFSMERSMKPLKPTHLVFLFFTFPGMALAGEIVGFSWFSGIASVAGTAVLPPVSPNNDDVAGQSPNELFVTQKHYTGIGPVDLVFDVVNSGGTTEYYFKEGVQNSTGLDWTSYHLELGFGTGVDFVKSTSGDGLDFDAPDYNSTVNFNPAPGFFPLLDVTEDDIIASGGVMPNFSFAGYFEFHVDVPDGISQFTVRQSPVVASQVALPSSLLLLAFMLPLLRRIK